MSGLFDRVKTLINIREYIVSETGLSAERAGGAWRVNPCPFCDHRDCFTIKEDRQFFKCFSCSVKGDVIEFEQKYRHLESPLDAARAIAEKRGIQIDNEGHGEKIGPETNKKKPADAPKIDGEPEIDPNRAVQVRRIAAEYYHGRLLASQEAMEYQTQERRHSIDVVSRLMLGLGGGRLIAHCRGQGVSVDELMSVGLVKQLEDGRYLSTVSGGVTVYPHFRGEDVLFFTLKDPKKKKKWQLRRNFAAEGWLCYGQDSLEQSETPVVIVEGENDRITVMDLGKHENVIATIASYNEPAILSRLKEISKGRTTWYLAFDNDPPPSDKPEGAGARYTRQYANTLLAGGGDVRVIRIKAGKDGDKSDIDDVLRAADDPAAEMARLIASAEKITEPIPRPGPPDHPLSDDYSFESFEVLGELQDERLLFWSKVNERLYAVALKDLNLDKLVQIGGVEVASKVSRSLSTRQSGQVLFGAVKKRVIVDAGKRQLWDPKYLGQGFHGLSDDRVLIVVGGRAWVWDGRRLAEWTHPVIEKKLIDWRQGYDWVDMAEVLRLLKRMVQVSRSAAD